MHDQTPARAHSDVPPAFQGYAVLKSWALTDEGMAFKAQLKPPGDTHPFRAFRAGSGGQRFHVSLHYVSPTGDHRALGAWEAMLSWWSDDPRNGMMVHFQLSGEEARGTHPLDGLTKRDELYMACWLVGDDEAPQEPANQARKKKSWDTLRPAQQAHVLSRDPEFAEWAAGRWGTSPDGDGAVSAIRMACGITSRKEFSIDDARGLDARNRWKSMMSDFFEWRRLTRSGGKKG